MRRYLDILRKPQRPESSEAAKVLIDNTLYNDNAYISDLYNTVESAEQEQAWSQEDSCVATDGFREAAPSPCHPETASDSLYYEKNEFNEKTSKVLSINTLEASRPLQPITKKPPAAPPAEQEERISVTFLFDEDDESEPMDPAKDEPLEAAVRFEVQPGLEVWLVPDEAAAAKLGLRAGSWLTPAELALLEGLTPEERIWVLQYMTRLGGRLIAAPCPEIAKTGGEWNETEKQVETD